LTGLALSHNREEDIVFIEGDLMRLVLLLALALIPSMASAEIPDHCRCNWKTDPKTLSDLETFLERNAISSAPTEIPQGQVRIVRERPRTYSLYFGTPTGARIENPYLVMSDGSLPPPSSGVSHIDRFGPQGWELWANGRGDIEHSNVVILEGPESKSKKFAAGYFKKNLVKKNAYEAVAGLADMGFAITTLGLGWVITGGPPLTSRVHGYSTLKLYAGEGRR
jgi:hypothetical protein